MSQPAPIYLNLSGDYTIPEKGRSPEVGSVSGDLRLASLDAFLHALHSAANSKEHATQFETALSSVIKQCAEGRKISDAGLTLSITSKLNPKSNEITYNFTIANKTE